MAGQELKTTSITEGGVGDFHLLSIVCLSTFHHALKQEQCLSCSPIHPIPQPRVWSTSIGASHPTSSCSCGSPRCAALFSVSVTVHSSVQVREAQLHSPSLPRLHSRTGCYLRGICPSLPAPSSTPLYPHSCHSQLESIIVSPNLSFCTFK